MNTGGSSANDSDLFALDVDTLLWPERGMMDDSLKGVDAFVVGNVSLGGEAGCHYEVLALCKSPVFRLDVPFALRFLKLGIDNYTLERAVLLDVEDSVDMVEVGSKLLVVGVVCAPRPVLPYLWDGVFVLRNLSKLASMVQEMIDK